MSPAQGRQRLRAAIWAAMETSNRCDADCPRCAANVAHAMNLAGKYAEAIAESRIERMTPGQLRARLRLAEVTAEAHRRTA